jgi:hypothetical protein
MSYREDPADAARRAMWSQINVYGEPQPAETTADGLTTAEVILEAFDGRRTDAEGRNIFRRIAAEGGVYHSRENGRYDPYEKYVFEDGSALTFDDDGELVLGHAGCFCRADWYHWCDA